jgi:hypothetical protein
MKLAWSTFQHYESWNSSKQHLQMEFLIHKQTYIYIRKTNHLILLGKIIAVYSQNHTNTNKTAFAKCGVFNDRGGTYWNHSYLKGYRSVSTLPVKTGE